WGGAGPGWTGRGAAAEDRLGSPRGRRGRPLDPRRDERCPGGAQRRWRGPGVGGTPIDRFFLNRLDFFGFRRRRRQVLEQCPGPLLESLGWGGLLGLVDDW